ncbi:MAG TPA: hypothetical protein VHD59_06820 [Pseudolabrys sp.]|nr:hypothetical protein [Pseudolabrys sp.]
MAKVDDDKPYKLKLTGEGITIDQNVSQAVAQKIIVLAMGGAVAGGTQVDSVATSGQPLDPNVSAKAFMAAKRPNTDMERIACLAYFLLHNRQVQAFKTRELTDLNIEAAQPKLSNPSFAARNAVSKQYLSLAGGGRKQITPIGEALVEALPDREAVKKALESQPPRRRRRSRTRKAKAK